MSARATETKTPPVASTDATVHIIGPNELQNELLAMYLQQELGLVCARATEFALPDDGETDAGHIHIILFDCLQNDPEPMWAAVEKGDEESTSLFFVSLFNARPDEGFTREAMARRARGVFYQGTPPGVLKKGILAILDGELWYSREALSQFLMEPRTRGNLPEDAAETLTTREKEILTRIAAGASNKEIADSLFISLHTVKSHIYNIYKKIGVTNRLRAAQWVQKHLKPY